MWLLFALFGQTPECYLSLIWIYNKVSENVSKQNISLEILSSYKKYFSDSPFPNNVKNTTMLVIQSFWVNSLKMFLALVKSKWVNMVSAAILWKKNFKKR